MKKIFTLLLLFCVFGEKLFAKENTLPVPSLRYSCDAITNGHEILPVVGTITAVITSGESATTYKTDASVENDVERGNVLYLPNTVDANGKGDAAAYYRSLRIISNESLVGMGNFTLSFWTKVKAQTAFNAFPPVFLFDGMSSGKSFQFRNSAYWNVSDGVNMPSLQFNDGSAKNLNVSLDPSIFVYDWTNYVVVKDGTTLKFYINGILRASNTSCNLANTELKQLRFNGQAHAGGSLFDDIQIFQSALDDNQVAELFGTRKSVPMRADFENVANDSLVVGSKWHDDTDFSLVPQIGNNPSKTGLNTSDKCYFAQTKNTNWWGQFGELLLKTPVTITENNRYLKFMVYRTLQTYDIRIAVNGSNAEPASIYQSKPTNTAAWEYVVVDLGPRMMGIKLKSIIFVFNCRWSGDSDETGMHAFDNFELSDNANVPVHVSVGAYPAVGGNVSPSSGYYASGKSLALSATPNSGYYFDSWTLNGVKVSSEANYTVALLDESAYSNYIAHFKQSAEVFPCLTVNGSYYEIEPLDAGTQIFRNRDNMPLQDIPDDFSGWKFLKISARSTSNPVDNREAPEYTFKTSVSGSVYVMVATNEQPDNASVWASSGGWESVPVYKAAYGTNDPNKVLSFYKKTFTAGLIVSMVFPDVFSRATLIAPDIQEESTVSVKQTYSKEIVSQEVFSLAGVKVASGTSNLPKGIYMVKTVYSNNGSQTQKMVVSK